MILVDAISINGGGGLEQLKQMLKHWHSEDMLSIPCKVRVLACRSTINYLVNNGINETHFISPKIINMNVLIRSIVANYVVTYYAKKYNSIVLNLSGTYFGRGVKYISMPQNMLVLKKDQGKLFKNSASIFRLLWLRSQTFKSLLNANVVVALHPYTKEQINKIFTHKKVKIIPLASSLSPSLLEKELQSQSKLYEFDLLSSTRKKLIFPCDHITNSYCSISTINRYKHTHLVIESFLRLLNQGLDVRLILGGKIFANYEKVFISTFKRAKKLYPTNFFYIGHLNHDQMMYIYNHSKAAIFSSSCENFPISLIETIQCKIPIISSAVEPMISILGTSASYFEPTSIVSLMHAINHFESLPNSQVVEKVNLASKQISKYTWARHARSIHELACEVLKS